MSELCQNCGHSITDHDGGNEGCAFSDPVRNCDCPSFTPPVDEREKAIDEWAIHAALVDLHFQTNSVRKCAAINDLLERAKRVTDYKARLLAKLEELECSYRARRVGYEEAKADVRRIVEEL